MLNSNTCCSEPSVKEDPSYNHYAAGFRLNAPTKFCHAFLVTKISETIATASCDSVPLKASLPAPSKSMISVRTVPQNVCMQQPHFACLTI